MTTSPQDKLRASYITLFAAHEALKREHNQLQFDMDRIATRILNDIQNTDEHPHTFAYIGRVAGAAIQRRAKNKG